MVTPVALTDALPLLNEDDTGRNTAQDVRMGMIVPLFMPGSAADEFGLRQGVLNRGQTNSSMRVAQNTSPDRNVRINGGVAVIHRSGQGSYLVYTVNSITTLQLDLSDATNPCVEAVVCRLYDKNLAADSGAPLHGPYFDAIRGVPGASINLNGTPGTAGAPPVVPEGCVTLAFVTRAAGAPGNAVADASITDKRRSAGLLGATRVLLPGDSASEAGFLHGERRGRMVGTRYLEDYWSTIDNKWHGTRTLEFPGVPVGTTGTVAVPTSGTGLTWGSVTIPDLGYDYTVNFGAAAAVFNLDDDSAAVVYIKDGSASGTVLAQGQGIARNGYDASPALGFHKSLAVSAGTAKTFYMTIQAFGDAGSIVWQDTFKNFFTAYVYPA